MFNLKIGYSWELKKWVAVVLELAGIRRLSFSSDGYSTIYP